MRRSGSSCPSELQKRSTGRTVYVLDEPTTGLHFEDIRKLLLVLGRLVDQGNTVLVIEHNLDVIKTADWLVDMGPEGGNRGGYVVAEGTPEEVAAHPDSYTGQFLAPLLADRAGQAAGEEAAPHDARPRRAGRDEGGHQEDGGQEDRQEDRARRPRPRRPVRGRLDDRQRPSPDPQRTLRCGRHAC